MFKISALASSSVFCWPTRQGRLPNTGEPVAPKTLRAEIAGVLAATRAAEMRLTLRTLAVGGMAVAALRSLG